MATTLHPLQIAVLTVVIVSAAVFFWRVVRKGIAADDAFFRTARARLAQVLEPKGFRLLPRPQGALAEAQFALFERSDLMILGTWEPRDREVRLETRVPGHAAGASEIVAGSSVVLPVHARPPDYEQALERLVRAVGPVVGAA